MIYQAMVKVVLLTAFVLTGFVSAWAAESDTARGDRMLAEYFQIETAKLRDRCLADIASAEDWKTRRDAYRAELLEMLGLDPLPERTDLKATVTGRIERDDFVVEKLHFQSRPGLYVTANLYLPKQLDKPAPTILYLCGHGACKEKGVSYGNKVSYHHHGCWFARNGYVCLTIDTLQLGEIEGSHHGTHRQGRWWWLNRGYTPAGVEAWNCVRALDYLESREEVDANRIGATGRSGGGVYSWWVTAIDDRIKAAAPVAGITDLENHVVDGRIVSHCDCNFMVNRYRWDSPLVAALAAPRPLLLCNSDQDRIFPLDGVMRVHEKMARVYSLLGVRDNLGLVVTPGDHQDTQMLQIPVLAWFNKHLKGDESVIETAAVKFFTPRELKVFAELPKDELNTRIDETFVPAAPAPRVPESREDWTAMRDAWRKGLLDRCFAGWPEQPPALDVQKVFSAQRDGLRFETYDYTSQEGVRPRMYRLGAAGSAKAERVAIRVLDEAAWRDFLAAMRTGFEAAFAEEKLPKANPAAFARCRETAIADRVTTVFVVPRGIGPTRWNQKQRQNVQISRRFMVLGQTVDGMRVWDARRAIQAARTLPGMTPEMPIEISSRGVMAGVALFASLFEPNVARLSLEDLPATVHDGPIFLNVRRVLDMPEAVAMAAEGSRVVLIDSDANRWPYPIATVRRLSWPRDRLEFVAGEPTRQTEE